MSCDDGDRDWSNASMNEGTPGVVSSHQRPGEKHGIDFPQPPQKANPGNNLISTFLASLRIGNKLIVSSHLVCGYLLWYP